MKLKSVFLAIALSVLTASPAFAGWESLGTFKTTGYCNCPRCAGKWAYGPTATGKMPEEGRTVAVDPSVIPLGSHLLIDNREYVAEDTGDKWVQGKHIDMYYNDHWTAYNHGTKKKQVFIWR